MHICSCSNQEVLWWWTTNKQTLANTYNKRVGVLFWRLGFRENFKHAVRLGNRHRPAQILAASKSVFHPNPGCIQMRGNTDTTRHDSFRPGIFWRLGALGISKKSWIQTYFGQVTVDSVEVFRPCAFWRHGTRVAFFFVVLKNCIFWGGSSLKLIKNLADLVPKRLGYETLLSHWRLIVMPYLLKLRHFYGLDQLAFGIGN